MPRWWLLNARNLIVRDTDSEGRRQAVRRDEMFAALASNLKAEIKALGNRTIQETDGPPIGCWLLSGRRKDIITPGRRLRRR
jgi:hypothetical protein